MNNQPGGLTAGFFSLELFTLTRRNPPPQLPLFLDYITVVRRLSCNTVAAYRSDLTDFFIFCADQIPEGETAVPVYSREQVRAYLQHCRKRGLSSRSLSRRLAALRAYCNQKCGVILGHGIGDLSGRAIRIAHMGHVNAPMMLGTLSVIEVGLNALGIPHGKGGAQAAIDWLGEQVKA